MSRADLLIELGTEELPPKALRSLRDAFARGMAQQMTAARLDFGTVTAYATPRRLAVKITDVLAQQPDQVEEKLGPSLGTAFNAEGVPTPAALGFARSCGVDLTALEQTGEGKQARLVHRMLHPGKPTPAVLPALVSHVLGDLPIPKRMRWGANRHEFVRPVHWLVLLFGTEIVPGQVLGIAAGRHSHGHRFHSPAPVAVTSPADYPDCLEPAWVLAEFDRRRAHIEAGVRAAATALGGEAILDPALLDEVTALTEWPVPLVGSFDERFLAIPAEALIASMKGHQKYFPVQDADGHLMNCFITLANLQSRDPAQVIHGNERVIRPRLTDASFFFEQDRKQPLAARFEQLRSVTFQVELGSLADKTERMISLAGWLAERIGIDPALARRAALLSKCDLMTDMVGEFDELQGIMGAHYARLDGEPEEVALALREQYRPAFAGDALPTTLTGCAVSLADRLDTLIGIFGIDQSPTGSKDPFGLRRAAIGILRILIERGLNLDLQEMLAQARAGYGSLKREPVEPVRDYVLERLRAFYEDQNIPAEVFLSVMARDPVTPLDIEQRIRAVDHFRRLPEASALAAAHKRVANILAKSQTDAGLGAINPALLQEPAEQALFEALAAKRAETEPLLTQRDYTAVLSALATLRAPVDAFFDTVLVNVEDTALRANRLALLAQLRALFWEVADIAQLPAAR